LEFAPAGELMDFLGPIAHAQSLRKTRFTSANYKLLAFAEIAIHQDCKPCAPPFERGERSKKRLTATLARTFCTGKGVQHHACRRFAVQLHRGALSHGFSC
jgi:hypothetical protein